MNEVKNITELTTEDFNKYISVWGLTVGLNSPTDSLMKAVIRKFLLDYYPYKKPTEITEAFHLYAAQKLDFKDAVYNNINPTFIGKVLASYGEYCRQQNVIKGIAPKVQPKSLAAPKLDPEQEGKRAFQFIKDNWKEGDIRPYNWTDAFKWLKLDLSENDKEKLKKQVLKNIAIEKQKRKERRTSYADLEDVSHKRNEYYKLAVLKVIKAYRAKT